MDTEDRDIVDTIGKPAQESRLLIWPWLVLLGLSAIAAGVIGPMAS